MYGYENGVDLQDMEFCACGARDGVYVMRDEGGYWYVCEDCDLPLKGTYTPFESESRYADEEYED